MKSRCTLDGFVATDDIIEGLIDQAEQHIFYYHTDMLRKHGLDAIRTDYFVMETIVGDVGKPGNPGDL